MVHMVKETTSTNTLEKLIAENNFVDSIPSRELLELELSEWAAPMAKFNRRRIRER